MEEVKPIKIIDIEKIIPKDWKKWKESSFLIFDDYRQLLDSKKREMVKPKLEIELVPNTCWFTNLRSILDATDWDKIRKQVYEKADYRCGICGGKGDTHPVEAHEVFEYHVSENSLPEIRSQVLTHVQALCEFCHEAKHMGLAQIRGFGERAKETLMRVNKWNEKETEEYVRMKFEEWSIRSKYQWHINIDRITDYGIDLNKYKEKLKAHE